MIKCIAEQAKRRAASALEWAKAINERCRHFPVVEGDRLIGLISIGDLIHLVSRDQADRIDAGILAMKAISGR